MKRLAALLALAAVFATAFWWFARRPAPPVAPAAPVTAAVDPKLAERRQWFGEEALAADVQWRESGLGYRIQNPGTPPRPGIGAAVRLTYRGRLKNGTVFDQSDQPTEFLVGGTIHGLSTGLQMLGAGGKATFFIPPSLGYGHAKVMGIPPDSGLIFEVTVAEIRPH